MKKYLPYIFGAIVMLVIFAPQKQAKAFSTTLVSTYFQANSLFVDHTGTFNIDWQKVQLGFGGYNLPSGYGLMVVANATTTLPQEFFQIDIGSNSVPCTNNRNPHWGGDLISWYVQPGCSGDTFSQASTNNFGNSGQNTQIWDGAAGAYIAANTITQTTPIYIVLVSGFQNPIIGCGGGGCQAFYVSSTVNTYLDAVALTPNFITRGLSAVISTPPNGTTGPDFNSWAVSMNNNETSTATGTIQITYALQNATATIIGVDTSTFSFGSNGSGVIDIAKSVPLYYPQAQGPIAYTAYLHLDTSVESFATSSINFSINGTTGSGPCDAPAGINLTTPVQSSTIVNDFPTWAVATPQLLEGCTYNLQVIYQPAIGSLVARTDQTNINVTPTNNPAQITIPKSTNLWNFYNATTTLINYTGFLYNTQDGIVVGSTQGGFYLGYSATSSPQTTPVGFTPSLQCGGVCNNFGTLGSGVAGGSIFTPSSTVAEKGAACPVPQDGIYSFFTGADFVYGICESLNWIFVPNDGTEGILAGDMQTLQTVPPFSWFFATNNIIIQGAGNGFDSTATLGNATSGAVAADGSVKFTIQTGINGATNTMTLLPANLTANTFLSNGRLVDDWYNLVLTLVICIAIIAVWKIAL